jgi:hypothetical protein
VTQEIYHIGYHLPPHHDRRERFWNGAEAIPPEFDLYGSVEEIILHQQHANLPCEKYAMRLNLNLCVVEAGDEKGSALAIAFNS